MSITLRNVFGFGDIQDLGVVQKHSKTVISDNVQFIRPYHQLNWQCFKKFKKSSPGIEQASQKRADWRIWLH